MKVALINPPEFKGKKYIREGRCMQSAASWGSLWMPLSLSYTASFLKKNSHYVELIDCQAENLDYRGLLDRIGKFSPSIIVISTGFPSIKGDMRTSSEIKKFDQNIKTIVFGMYPTLIREKTLEEFENIDFAVMGEPEWVVCNLANSLENNESFAHHKGLIYRDGERIIVNPPQDYRENNLDDLPFPAREHLNNESYRLAINNEKFTHINIARGCSYKCTFCTASNYNGDTFRKRSISSIINEIEECINDYGIKTFIFWFEEYPQARDLAGGLADTIIEKGLPIKWFARSRVDNLSYELLKKMKRSGCKGISLGIESSNQQVLDLVQKGITVKQIRKAIELAKEVGISTTGHFIFGLPGETRESAEETIKFAKICGLDFAQFYCAVPYPNTPFGNLAKANGWIHNEDYSRYHLSESVARNEYLTSEEIVNIRTMAYNSFYLRPSFVWKAIILSIRNRSIKHIRGFRKWSKS
jgi:anaerobic magnesium-protoporphyrin IX monomethyl ester cyclase